MKINWGKGIVLAFVGFISFILFFVYRMTTDERASHDLVTDDYYRKELLYQQDIDAEQAAKDKGMIFRTEKTAEGLRIIFPPDIQVMENSGIISLYRPSSKKLDFELPFSSDNSDILIPEGKLLEGRWDLSVRWMQDGEDHLYKTSFTY